MSDECILVRDTTRQAWDTLRHAGEIPSVRKVYAVVGGAYNTVTAECRALRLERVRLAAAVCTPEVPAARAPVPEASLVHWPTSPALRAAFADLRQELRQNRKFRQRMVLWARSMGNRPGEPLERLIEALRRTE
jgi:hypothetical protein